MKRMKIKPEHAGPKNRGGFWGSREEAKEFARLVRRRLDKTLIEEGIAMCGRADDPSQHDAEAQCPVCEGPTTKAGRLCWYCDDEPDDAPDTDPFLRATLKADPYLEAILRADRDDPHTDNRVPDHKWWCAGNHTNVAEYRGDICYGWRDLNEPLEAAQEM